MTLFRKLVELLEERDAGDIVVFGGGIVPEEDVAPLTRSAWPRSSPRAPPPVEITDWVAEHFPDRARLDQRQKTRLLVSGRPRLGASALVVMVTGCAAGLPA